MKLALKIPPAVVTLIIAAVMWWIGNNLDFSRVIFDPLLWVSFIFLGIGGGIGLLGLVAFYKASTSIDPHKPKKASNLVTNGIYSISRNPMYLGLLMILIGYGFYLGNILVFIMIPLFVGYMNRFQIIPEERVMEEKFDDEFHRYKSEVRRWF
ncbi:protein-S-isoprenylcysteine methyltransferase [Aliifodinibius salipaludis]|uniref:Protein-S-isoprenylcysteine methyltransferase n=1 Tax=Fodinibius salipaludis TaxID=2032627 RepID=A0A2A2GBS7_9BACT|nr:isoprenylcysteine carboxylmethyltransferase family protein [Aliifodinibius salipaludis]PAU94434.1 protein-S-isoprenylcysteine methyltransferase [Aliifodinibius salipaludis]